MKWRGVELCDLPDDELQVAMTKTNEIAAAITSEMQRRGMWRKTQDRRKSYG